jgi:hypothetical protein
MDWSVSIAIKMMDSAVIMRLAINVMVNGQIGEIWIAIQMIMGIMSAVQIMTFNMAYVRHLVTYKHASGFLMVTTD